MVQKDHNQVERVCPVCGESTVESRCPTDGTATIVAGGTDRDPLSYRAGDLISGRYEIESALRRGGFGAVYVAKHTGTGQKVAIKMLSVDTATGGDDVMRRFYREARVTAALTSQNTVRVFDVGQAESGPLYLVMEFLRGASLDRVLRKVEASGKRMSESAAIDIAIPILKSLAEAHGAGLVHRDLKPSNVMLTRAGYDETIVKVLDFGIAQATNSSKLTAAGKALGTPAFMSPEQVTGQDVDGRSDLYSLGVLLFRCVCGRLPFDAENGVDIAMMHLQDEVPDICVLAPSVSAAFVECVQRAMAKKRSARFVDARAMRHALEGIRGGAWAGTPAHGDVADAQGSLVAFATPAAEVDVVVDSSVENLAADDYTDTQTAFGDVIDYTDTQTTFADAVEAVVPATQFVETISPLAESPEEAVPAAAVAASQMPTVIHHLVGKGPVDSDTGMRVIAAALNTSEVPTLVPIVPAEQVVPAEQREPDGANGHMRNWVLAGAALSMLAMIACAAIVASVFWPKPQVPSESTAHVMAAERRAASEAREESARLARWAERDRREARAKQAERDRQAERDDNADSGVDDLGEAGSPAAQPEGAPTAVKSSAKQGWQPRAGLRKAKPKSKAQRQVTGKRRAKRRIKMKRRPAPTKAPASPAPKSDNATTFLDL